MKKKAFRAALPYTLPICVGFLLIGASYGLLMRSKGFSVWYPMAMSALIYAGSMEFVTVNLLLSAFRPLYAFLLTLMVNARHLFYGISMLQKYEGLGWKRLYLIYGMCDESFSINCTVTPPEGVDRGWFMFFVTLLNQIYWVSGATLGALLGLGAAFQHRGHRVYHDGAVRRDVPRPVGKGEGSQARAHRRRLLGGVSAGLRRAELHYPGDGIDRAELHARAQPAGEGGAGMTLTQQIIMIGVVVLGTMVTRFLPFLIFPQGKTPPKFVQYLGTVLPTAVIGLLVVYGLKDAPVSATHGLPEAIAIAAIYVLHRWKKSTLLSIGGGTLVYMLLVQLVF